MRFSLGARVFALVAAINVAAFLAAGFLLNRTFVAENRRLQGVYAQRLGYVLSSTIQPAGDLNVARILSWPGWPEVRDALVIDSTAVVGEGGLIEAPGVVLNPVGTARRPADFDRQEVLQAAYRAMQSGEPQLFVAGGQAVPIVGRQGLWGACWYEIATPVDLREVLGGLVPAFLASTLLLTAITWLGLRRLVLGPVALLAQGARRVQSGDLGTRLAEPQRHDELADLMRAFNEMTAEVQGFNRRLSDEVRLATDRSSQAVAAAMTQRRLAAMGELAAGIAHEINNPLGGLINAVEALERPDLAGERRTRYHALLRDGLDRIRQTVGKLLRFTPRESGHAPVDLVDVCVDAMALVRHRAENRGVQVELEVGGLGTFAPGASPPLEGRPAPIPGLRNELGQSILNLLVNALDALEEAGRPGRVRLVVQAVAGGRQVRVEDDGPGVDAEALERVSDLFYTTKEVGKGTGLGLSIVHRVVAEHGGRVRIQSAPGEGFRVALSFLDDPEGAEPGAAEPTP